MAKPKYKLTVGYLYPDLMNIYGDIGNIITLKKRCEWRGIEVEIKSVSIGDKLKAGECDLYFFGGGQDQEQQKVADDLVKSRKDKVIKEDIKRGVPALCICGGYQLLGAYYKPLEGPKLAGIGVLPIYTEAGEKRMIGNTVARLLDIRLLDSTENLSKSLISKKEVILTTNGSLVGFENHSGKTYLTTGAQPLGKIIKGFGNNGEDQTEGVIYKNAIGCYLHGSLLPKNPQLADWLIQRALEVKYGKGVKLESLDDNLEDQAHEFALAKFS